jgi:cbb3-type cytochrome oxidase subunit 1
MYKNTGQLRKRRFGMQAEAINPRLVKFIWAGAIFFAWSLIQGFIQGGIESVRLIMEAGPGGMIGHAHTHVGLMGWTSLPLMAAIYYLVPIFSGKSIVWPKLVEWIFWIFVTGTAVGSVLYIVAGITGGNAFAAGVTGAELHSVFSTYATSGGIFCTISAIAGLMFIVQILTSLARGSKTSS